MPEPNRNVRRKPFLANAVRWEMLERSPTTPRSAFPLDRYCAFAIPVSAARAASQWGVDLMPNNTVDTTAWSSYSPTTPPDSPNKFFQVHHGLDSAPPQMTYRADDLSTNFHAPRPRLHLPKAPTDRIEQRARSQTLASYIAPSKRCPTRRIEENATRFITKTIANKRQKICLNTDVV